jgi:hypothetical protein
MLALQERTSGADVAVARVARSKGKGKRRARVLRLPPPTISEVIQVFLGEELVGNVYLDDTESVLKCDGSIPRDVVFKALVQVSRSHNLSGEIVGRQDGRTYRWDVVDEDELAEMVGL